MATVNRHLTEGHNQNMARRAPSPVARRPENFRFMFVATSSIQSRRLLLVSTPAASCIAQTAPRVVLSRHKNDIVTYSILCLVVRGASVVISQCACQIFGPDQAAPNA